ncbi:MAG TPA: CoA pyrophosphatase [Longimicrobiales bacterium]|nr:CoA pyrophosphatase [Longimicrobiales bacterium]
MLRRPPVLRDARFAAIARALERRAPNASIREAGDTARGPAPVDPDGPLDRRELAGAPPETPVMAQAAVLLALRPADPLELLVIERAEREGDPWSGHMALPGGRRQSEDRDLLETALRETREETALVVPRTAVLGGLRSVNPGGGRRRFSINVTPYVAAVDPAALVVPEPSEVETALWVPLTHLASDDAVDELLIELEGESRAFPALSYQEYVIWGLTHRILEDFIGVARTAGLV